MIKLVLTVLSSLMLVVGIAQTDVELKINHKLGVEDFMLDAVGTNNLGHSFKANRLEYYVTRITIVHDGGMETAVPDEVVALVRPEDEISTTIELGNFALTDIESVKFHIGVYAPLNNEDPSVWDVSHPLGPKSPSMHWGWASGYRFIAYEGFGGADFSQNFQLHGLGNENYFEVESDVEVADEAGTLVMSLNGDYAAGLNDISLTDGTISHGSTGEAKKVLENWRDVVFGLYTVGLDEENVLSWSVYPNPSNGLVQLNFADVEKVESIKVMNALGELVQTITIANAQTNVELTNAGIYVLAVLNEEGETVATERVIIK